MTRCPFFLASFSSFFFPRDGNTLLSKSRTTIRTEAAGLQDCNSGGRPADHPSFLLDRFAICFLLNRRHWV
ncbi:hypothetical protein ACP70R_037773 [Stipagrostis hirtigluma subsp. patula]